MTVYFCVDERMGMAFNSRRQSRDSAVLADIQSRLTGELLIDPMSRKLVERAQIPWCLALSELPEGEFHYFAEERHPGDWVAQCGQVVLYHWNRHYPADRWFDIDLAAMGFSLVDTQEFPGSSHEKITREVYAK